jgi:hypothetical protein
MGFNIFLEKKWRCSACGTYLNYGFDTCYNCGFNNVDNIIEEINRISEIESNRIQEQLEADTAAAKEAGYDNLDKYFVDLEKYKQEQLDIKYRKQEKFRGKFNSIKSYRKVFDYFINPLISILFIRLILPNWWFIFKLIPASIFYYILYEISENIEDYYRSKYLSYLNKIESTGIIEKLPSLKSDKLSYHFNKEENQTINTAISFNSINENNSEIKNTDSSRIRSKVVIDDSSNYRIEFDSQISIGLVLKIKDFIKDFGRTRQGMLKIKVSNEGKYIRNIGSGELSTLIDFLETVSIYTKNKSKYYRK